MSFYKKNKKKKLNSNYKILFYKKNFKIPKQDRKKRFILIYQMRFGRKNNMLLIFFYDDNFNEKQIPTKTRPSQMNVELKIKDLKFKKPYIKIQITLIMCSFLC
jgi:hypothetical protein